MPLPSVIQGTDTFNTWLDATNNLISHVANTDVYVLVNNTTSTGNVSVNGSIGTATLVANANVVLGGSSLVAATPIFKLTTNSLNSNTISMLGSNLTIAMTNTVLSGTDLSIGQNTVIVGKATITGVVNVTANTTLTSSILALTTNATQNTVTIGANVVSVVVNALGAAYSSNGTTYSVNAVNTLFTGTNLSISPNTTVHGTLFVNNTLTVNGTMSFDKGATFNGNATFTANAIFNSGMFLGGAIERKSSFITNAAAALSGAGIASPLAVEATTTVYRLSSSVADKIISGVQQANTTQYRELIIFNIGAYDMYLQHANTDVSVGANAVYCPGNTNFMIPSQGVALLYYDANTSIQRWRVLGGSSTVIANTTANGYVSTTTQSFAGAKTFTGAVNATSTLGVSGAVNALSTVGISGAVNALGTLGVSGVFTALVNSTLTGAATLSNTLSVTGAATFSANANIIGVLYVSNTVNLNANASGRLVLPVGTNKWAV